MKLTPQLGSQLDLLVSRLDRLQTLRDERLLRIRREEELTQQALISGSSSRAEEAVAEFSGALLEYRKSLRDERAEAAVEKVVAEEAAWRGALVWSRLTGTWTDVWPARTAAIEARIQEIQAHQRDYSLAPDALAAATAVAQLQGLLARDASPDPSSPGLKERLKRVFSNDLIAKSWVLRTRDARVFHLPDGIRINPGPPNRVPFFVGYSRNETEILNTVKFEEWESPLAASSPSSVIAEFATGRLADLKPDGWSAFTRDLAVRIRDDRDLNAYLKYDLLRRVIEAAGEGDAFLAAQLKLQLNLLKSAPINPLAKWMHPDDADGKKAVEDAQRVLSQLAGLTELEDAWNKAEEERLRFDAGVRQKVLLVGWLEPRAGGWECRSAWKPDGEYALQVVFVDPARGAGEWRTIGTAAGDKLELRRNIDSFLAHGRPVFAVRNAR